MIIGPVFTREVVTAPRRPRFYIARAVYVTGLVVLMATAWLVLTGTQDVGNLGDLARFGTSVFQILAPLQLALVIFFSALFTASGVAQEKDRKTLVLLLLTHLTNSELVLGKLFACLLTVFVLIVAGLPVFMALLLLGGVSLDQILRITAVTVASALAAGSLGSVIALWREKTFQALALTVLVLVAWIAFWGAVGAGLLGSSWGGISTSSLATVFSPWNAIVSATLPYFQSEPIAWYQDPVHLFLIAGVTISVLLNLIGVFMVRVWNPSREMQPREDEAPATESATGVRNVHAAGGKTRTVWDNPILWREVCTWAYGRKLLIIRFAYLALFAAAAFAIHQLPVTAPIGQQALILVPVFVLSLVLVNALAVTALTAERDNKAIDLLLVTDISPFEFVFGKLGGALYVTKEMVLLPMLLCGYVWWRGSLGLENLTYLIGGLVIMNLFVTIVGIHVGMSYGNSRSAVGVSLGTVFFLFLGVATCIRIMLAFSGSFQMQLAPFLAFFIGGGIGLFFGLGARNPSPAIGLASFLSPIATFIAIVSFFQQQTLGVFLVVAATYGFASAAMLIPALYEFDVATGRTTSDE